MFGKKAQEDKSASPATEPKTESLTYYDAGKDHDLMALQPQNKDLFIAMPPERGSELQSGAVAAFNEGRPENIQTLLARPDLFRLPMPPQRTLCSLTRNVADIEDKTAVILLAIEKIPDDKRRAFLDKTLSDLFSTNEYQCEEPFIAALISAGADANAVVHGAPGMPLAWAVTSGYPQAIVRLLHDHGASFEDALLRIQTRTYWDEGNRRELAVHKLKAYREAITGAPAGEESELRQEIAQLRAEIAALREEITRRLPVTDTPAANKARKPKSGGAQPSP